MNPITVLQNKIDAKLSLVGANQAIREAKAALNNPSRQTGSNADQIWNNAKAGQFPKFLTSNMAKDVLSLAVAEVKGQASAEHAPSLPSPLPASPKASSAPASAKPPAAPLTTATKPPVAPSDILAQFEAITDANSRVQFFRANKAAIKSAEAAKMKSQITRRKP